jgi:hypothetical protein
MEEACGMCLTYFPLESDPVKRQKLWKNIPIQSFSYGIIWFHFFYIETWRYHCNVIGQKILPSNISHSCDCYGQSVDRHVALPPLINYSREVMKVSRILGFKS